MRSPLNVETVASHFPFRDTRLRNSSGYPDWFLLGRGRVHDTFDTSLDGGRSQAEPMVVAAYGPLAEGRATIAPEGRSPFGSHTGGDSHVQFHQVVVGLEIQAGMSHLGMHSGCTSPGDPGVPTWYIEDCKIVNGQMNYLPIGTPGLRLNALARVRSGGHADFNPPSSLFDQRWF